MRSDTVRNETPQPSRLGDLGIASLASLILVAPLAVLEFLNQNIGQNVDGTLALFGFLWLLPVTFVLILLPAVCSLRTRDSLAMSPINLLFRIAVLGFIAVMWGSVVIDQFPCFMGVPNCD